ncbi:MAG: prepilin-type N-terminal cleavage/methylation domain-containing protein [Phycisphaerales bacterium]|nr:prepilin-type N-terminal cleavage/methylation domain-containing protein [Phycisphaerae bacterium]NNF43376.1 prepilin-type N-terminal cleavage/methylation domain-containing protein [Phycisphaerales bacterium]NNM25547.1 prepilin-type N-terminal cleavage/methylation domain-containing protein [Phycisphaerales bacterium]
MRNPKRAFTLIEILIVVVILGILAAIVIPQFTDASEDAMLSSVRSQLQTLRSQVELYKVQNQGVASDLVADQWTDLTGGDYIQQPPTNPFNDSTTVAGAAAAGVAWIWDGDDLFAADPTDVEGDADGVFSF